jgi:hypothetical protein
MLKCSTQAIDGTDPRGYLRSTAGGMASDGTLRWSVRNGPAGSPAPRTGHCEGTAMELLSCMTWGGLLLAWTAAEKAGRGALYTILA